MANYSPRRYMVKMEFELKIVFAKSSSVYYKDALEKSQKFSKYYPIDENNSVNKIIINQEEFRNKYDTIQKLFSIISNWSYSELHFNGRKISFGEINSFLYIIKCQNGYEISPNQAYYCQHENDKFGWGCKYLSNIRRQIQKESSYYYNPKYWFNYGHFENENIWIINKQHLLKSLKEEAIEKKVSVCKYFSFEKIEQIVTSLPDNFSLVENENWEIVYEEINDGVIVEKRPVNVKPKSMKNEVVESDVGIRINLLDKNKLKDEDKLNASNRFIPNVTFNEIGGIENIVTIIREVIELPLKVPKLFDYLGIKPHKGILLYGAPGCGKTLIAKAIANEIKAHFIPIKGPELLSKWYGQSEENLRNIFEEARNLNPSIIYFDEIDSIAQVRSSEESLRFDARFVNQLLTLMDGIEEYGNVCVIASTNRKELIDEALLRPGRFDYTIEIEKPTYEGCFKIFQIHTHKMPIEKEFDILEFSKKLFGLSGAEIAFVTREGAYNCLRKNVEIKKLITNNNVDDIDFEKLIIRKADFEKALGKIKNGTT